MMSLTLTAALPGTYLGLVTLALADANTKPAPATTATAVTRYNCRCSTRRTRPPDRCLRHDPVPMQRLVLAGGPKGVGGLPRG